MTLSSYPRACPRAALTVQREDNARWGSLSIQSALCLSTWQLLLLYSQPDMDMRYLGLGWVLSVGGNGLNAALKYVAPAVIEEHSQNQQHTRAIQCPLPHRLSQDCRLNVCCVCLRQRWVSYPFDVSHSGKMLAIKDTVARSKSYLKHRRHETCKLLVYDLVSGIWPGYCSRKLKAIDSATTGKAKDTVIVIPMCLWERPCPIRFDSVKALRNPI